MSKGSRQRPQQVGHDTFSSNWDRIFKSPKERDNAIAENEAFQRISNTKTLTQPTKESKKNE